MYPEWSVFKIDTVRIPLLLVRWMEYLSKGDTSGLKRRTVERYESKTVCTIIFDAYVLDTQADALNWVCVERWGVNKENCWGVPGSPFPISENV